MKFKKLEFGHTPFGIYIFRILISLSVLFNVILGGYPNQTFSARNWSWKRKKRYHIVPIIDSLTLNSDHCLESWVYWRVRKDVIHDEEKHRNSERLL